MMKTKPATTLFCAALAILSSGAACGSSSKPSALSSSEEYLLAKKMSRALRRCKAIPSLIEVNVEVKNATNEKVNVERFSALLSSMIERKTDILPQNHAAYSLRATLNVKRETAHEEEKLRYSLLGELSQGPEVLCKKTVSLVTRRGINTREP